MGLHIIYEATFNLLTVIIARLTVQGCEVNCKLIFPRVLAITH